MERDLAKEVDDGLNAAAVALENVVGQWKREMAELRKVASLVPDLRGDVAKLEAKVAALQAEVDRLRSLIEDAHPDGG